MIKSLNNSTVQRVERPVRILQFGEGNFLRVGGRPRFLITDKSGRDTLATYDEYVPTIPDAEFLLSDAESVDDYQSAI